jgi:hypothetical protein
MESNDTILSLYEYKRGLEHACNQAEPEGRGSENCDFSGQGSLLGTFFKHFFRDIFSSRPENKNVRNALFRHFIYTSESTPHLKRKAILIELDRKEKFEKLRKFLLGRIKRLFFF